MKHPLGYFKYFIIGSGREGVSKLGNISSLMISLIRGGGEGSTSFMKSSLNIQFFFFEVVP